MKKNPNVKYATPSYLIEPCAVPNDYSNYNLWGMERVQADKAWNEYTGSTSVTVGVVDSGIDHTHPDLAPNLNMNLAYNAQSNTRNDTMDYHGHGTHVAGTLGAKGNNFIGVTGVNWNVKMVPIKIAMSNTDEHTSPEIQKNAIRYATNNDIPILNMSYGFFNDDDFINTVRNYPGLLIISAGNGDSMGSNIDDIAAYKRISELPNVIIVANSDKGTGEAENIALGSNYGSTHVDIAAPGTDIYSTYPVSKGSYQSMHGTSMAAPHVTGVAALLKGKYPSMTAIQIKDAILSSADFVPRLVRAVAGGRRLNAYSALKRAGSAKHLVVQPSNNETMANAIRRSLGSKPASDITSIKLIGNAALGIGSGNDSSSAVHAVPNLEYVDMSDFNGTLKQYAFAYCRKLKVVWLPEGRRYSLPAYCFMACHLLNRLYKDKATVFSANSNADLTGLNSGITGEMAIQTQCFDDCTSLKYVKIPNTAAFRIGDYAFYKCTSLVSLQVEGRREKMSEADLREFVDLPPHAFEYTAFTSVLLPKDVTIGESCFRECRNLKEIQFHPDQVSMPGVYSLAFYGTHPDCKAYVNQIEYDEYGIPQSGTKNIPMKINAFHMVPIDGEMMSETIAYYFDECASRGISVTYADIKHIALWGSARMGALDQTTSASVLPNLEEVFITDFEGELGNHAFRDCKKLTEVTLSDKITRISSYCFMNCSRLNTVLQEGQIKVYGEANVSNLRGAALGTQSFQGTAFTAVKLPHTKISESAAFNECSKITTVYRNGHPKLEGIADLVSISSFGHGYNYRNSAIRTVKLPENVDIPMRAFENCTSLSEIKFPPLQTQKIIITMLAFEECARDCKAYMYRSLAMDSSFQIHTLSWGYMQKIAY